VHCRSGSARASGVRYVFGTSYDVDLVRMMVSSAVSGGVNGGDNGRTG
jgi:hypothetical protein